MTATAPSAAADRLAIQDLMVRYASALDSRDWELFRQVWAPDCVIHYLPNTVLHGYDEVRDFCDRALSRFRITQHLLGNYGIELDGDRARTTTSLQATHVPPDGKGPVYTVWGVYRDEVIRTADGWRILERTLEPTMTKTG